MPRNWLRRFSELVERRPRVVVLSFVIGVMVWVIPMSRLEIDTGGWGGADKYPEIAAANALMVERFGETETIVLLLEADILFSVDVVRQIRSLGRAVEGVDGVASVFHLGNARALDISDDWLEPTPILPETEVTPATIEALKIRLGESPIYRGRLVSPDQKSTLFVIHLDSHSDVDGSAVVRGIRGAISANSTPGAVHVLGESLVSEAVKTYLVHDLYWVIPILLMTLVLILVLSMQAGATSLLPPLCAAFSVIVTFGLQGIFGVPLTPGSMFLLPVLGANGCAYTVHIVKRFYEALEEQSPSEAAKQAIQLTALPTALTALTTMCAFLSLSLVGIETVSQVAIFGAIGIGVGALLAVGFAPAVLAWRVSTTRSQSEASNPMASLARALVNRPWTILVLVMIAVSVLTIGVFRVEVEEDPFALLPPSDRMVDAHRRFTAHGWNDPFYILVDSGEPNGAIQPSFLDRLTRLRWLVAAREEVVAVSGIDLLVTDVRQKMGQPVELGRTQQSEAEIAQALLLYEGSGILGSFIDMERRFARIGIASIYDRPKEQRSLFEATELLSHAVFSGNTEARLGGASLLRIYLLTELGREQVLNVAIVLVLICLIMWWLFRSFPLAVWMTLPTLVPLGALFGAMGWMGVSISPITMLMAATTVGIAIDGTIHVMVRYYRELREHAGQTATLDAGIERSDKLAAVGRAVVTVGGATWVTTLALSASFACLTLSDFPPLAHLGGLLALSMLVCFVSNIVVLPALLVVLPHHEGGRRSQEGDELSWRRLRAAGERPLGGAARKRRLGSVNVVIPQSSQVRCLARNVDEQLPLGVSKISGTGALLHWPTGTDLAPKPRDVLDLHLAYKNKRVDLKVEATTSDHRGTTVKFLETQENWFLIRQIQSLVIAAAATSSEKSNGVLIAEMHPAFHLMVSRPRGKEGFGPWRMRLLDWVLWGPTEEGARMARIKDPEQLRLSELFMEQPALEVIDPPLLEILELARFVVVRMEAWEKPLRRSFMGCLKWHALPDEEHLG